MAITMSDRTEYSATHLRRVTKRALQREAFRTKESMSRIISEAVEKELRARGHKLEEEINAQHDGHPGVRETAAGD